MISISMATISAAFARRAVTRGRIRLPPRFDYRERAMAEWGRRDAASPSDVFIEISLRVQRLYTALLMLTPAPIMLIFATARSLFIPFLAMADNDWR